MELFLYTAALHIVSCPFVIILPVISCAVNETFVSDMFGLALCVVQVVGCRN